MAAVALLLVGANMRKELSHDEHMYVAGGELLAKGLLPYRDYPYLQMPNLAFAYAGLFTGTRHLLLAARLLNTLCAALSAAVVFFTASSLFRQAGYLVRFLAAAGSVVLLIANAATRPALPTRRTLRQQLRYSLPFAGAVLLLPGPTATAARAYGRDGAQRPRRLYLLAAFCLGVLVGLLPAIGTAALAPARFTFGNVGYHALSETYWRQMGYTRAMSLDGKLAYLLDVAREPGTLVLLLAFALLGLLAVGGRARIRPGGLYPISLAAALTLSLAAGALGPTPTWYQYYYAPLPFLVLGVAYGAAALYASGLPAAWVIALLGLAALSVGALGVPGYARLGPSLQVEDWVPSRVHQAGLEIERAVGAGRVLTLAPLLPLEGGAGIYEQLAAGPFAWRVAGLMTADERQRLGVVGADDLDALLGPQPPTGILTGLEANLEGPLVSYAQAHGYRPRRLSNGATLWLPGP
jgi:hypothetical protein